MAPVGHQEIDVAVLVEGDLGLRVRGERAEHHGGAAALPPHQLGDGVDVLCGESDDGGAARQPRDLLVAGVE